MNREHERT